MLLIQLISKHQPVKSVSKIVRSSYKFGESTIISVENMKQKFKKEKAMEISKRIKNPKRLATLIVKAALANEKIIGNFNENLISQLPVNLQIELYQRYEYPRFVLEHMSLEAVSGIELRDFECATILYNEFKNSDHLWIKLFNYLTDPNISEFKTQFNEISWSYIEYILRYALWKNRPILSERVHIFDSVKISFPEGPPGFILITEITEAIFDTTNKDLLKYLLTYAIVNKIDIILKPNVMEVLKVMSITTKKVYFNKLLLYAVTGTKMPKEEAEKFLKAWR